MYQSANIDFISQNPAQFPLINVANPNLLRRHQDAQLRRVETLDPENQRLRDRFLAAEAERQRRQELGVTARQDRGPLIRLLRRIV